MKRNIIILIIAIIGILGLGNVVYSTHSRISNLEKIAVDYYYLVNTKLVSLEKKVKEISDDQTKQERNIKVIIQKFMERIYSQILKDDGC